MTFQNPKQFVLPFDQAKNDFLSQVAMLRGVDLGLSAGRAEGVVQLLERLALRGNDLREVESNIRVCSLANQTVKAVMVVVVHTLVGKLANVERRPGVCEKTVRNWRRDAERLGILQTEFNSRKFGRNKWNDFTINVSRIRELVLAGNGRKWPVTVTDPGAVTVTDPGAVTVTDLLLSKHDRKTNKQLTPSPNGAGQVVVVSSAISENQKDEWTDAEGERLADIVAHAGVGRAEEAIYRARFVLRLTPEQVEQRVDAWQSLPAADRRPGTLYNWLGSKGSYDAARRVANATPTRSRPTAAELAAQSAEHERRRREARELAITEPSLADQLRAAMRNG
jgi:hypothetical protein